MLPCTLLDVSSLPPPTGHPAKVTNPNNHKHNYHSTKGRSTGGKHQSPEREAPACQTALPSPRRFQPVPRQMSEPLTARVPLQRVGRGTGWFREGEEPDQCLNAYVHPAEGDSEYSSLDEDTSHTRDRGAQTIGNVSVTARRANPQVETIVSRETSISILACLRLAKDILTSAQE